MQESCHTVCWSAGDIVYIAHGEYAGTYARIWEIRNADNKAVVSLCVFRENEPFEIELSSLRDKPPSMKREWTKALLFSSATAVAGPAILMAYILAIDFFAPPRLAPLVSGETLAFVLSLPLNVSGLAAVYVGIRVLTDQDEVPG